MRHSVSARLRWTIYFDHEIPFYPRPWLLVPAGEPPFTVSMRISTPVTTINTGLSKVAQADPVIARKLLELSGANSITDHQGATSDIRPELPGDYKYGVKVEDAESGEILGDDHPILRVR